MREIYFNSNITSKTLNEIKLLAVYYDKINIVNDCIYTIQFDKDKDELLTKDLQFIPDSFYTDYKVLIDEKIISVTKRDESIKDNQFASEISKLLNLNEDYIFPIHPSDKDARIITEEVYEVMNTLLNFKPGKPIDKQFIWWYYAFKLNWSIKILLEGHNCINGSNNLNYLFNQYINQISNANSKIGFKGYNKSLAYDAIKLRLPNPDLLSFEDILELRYKLKDELNEFYQKINSIEIKNKNLFGVNDISDSQYSTIFYDEIQRPLKGLEIQMKNLKSKSFRAFIDKMKDPKSFVPLIGTVVASLPIQYTLLASIGIITSQSYLQFKEEQREITNNGLYFLLKI